MGSQLQTLDSPRTQTIVSLTVFSHHYKDLEPPATSYQLATFPKLLPTNRATKDYQIIIMLQKTAEKMNLTIVTAVFNIKEVTLIVSWLIIREVRAICRVVIV